MLPADAEPAIRDPRKLRNTALVLVVMIVVGGWLVLVAYGKWSASHAKDDRPAVIYRITPERDLRMLRQDNKIANLVDLRGKVIAINVTSIRDPQESERSMATMKRLAEKYLGSGDVRLVTLIVDPMPADQLAKTLAEVAKGGAMQMPLWWVGSNEPKTLHTFIKNELKANVFPNESNGRWNYDGAIVLIDKNGHIRRPVVPKDRGQAQVLTFDFNKAAEWDAKGLKSGTERSNVEELERLLQETIVKLLAEPFKP